MKSRDDEQRGFSRWERRYIEVILALVVLAIVVQTIVDGHP